MLILENLILYNHIGKPMKILKIIFTFLFVGISTMANSNTNVIYSPELHAKAQAGDAVSQLELANAYLYGNGIEEDGDIAEEWAIKAAENDNVDAMYLLGESYSTDALLRSDFDEEGSKEGFIKAAKWYQEAVKHNHAEAMLELSDLYESGDGVPKDEKQAFLLLEKAATLGVPQAMNKLRYAYEKGMGVETDLEKATYWNDLYEKNKVEISREELIVSAKKDKEMLLEWIDENAPESEISNNIKQQIQELKSEKNK